MMSIIDPIVSEVLARRATLPPTQALLVGLSGIDGSGKGYVVRELVTALSSRGLKSEAINADGWLNLPDIRYDAVRPAENFYENALRLDALFSQLALPLRNNRRVEVCMEWVDETATTTRPFTYRFDDLDVVVLEGIYLIKRAYRPLLDLAVWIDCSWETALERALARGQEGLPPAETVRGYRTIFFPAQELHFERDDPRGTADLIVATDPHLAERRPAGAI